MCGAYDVLLGSKEFTVPASTDAAKRRRDVARGQINVPGKSGAGAAGATKQVVINEPEGEYEYDCYGPGQRERAWAAF